MKFKPFEKISRNTATRRLTIIFICVFAVAFVFFLLRGPYLSNTIKRIIIPVLENATGERVIIDKAVINLFPFYVQIKGFKMFDEGGNKLLKISKMRAYLDILGIVSKELRIRRLTVNKPDLTADKKAFEKIMNFTGKKKGEGKNNRFSIQLKSTKIMDGTFHVTDMKQHMSLAGAGLQVEAVVNDTTDADIFLQNGTLKLPGFPELKGTVDVRLEAETNRIRIVNAELSYLNSSLKIGGDVYPASSGGVKQANFSGKAKILTQNISEMFGLKQVRDGELSLEGSVDLVPGQGPEGKSPKAKLDIKTNGRFYLETLMELVNVRENIKGHIDIQGKIHGVYPDIIGEGTVNAKDVELTSLPLDDLKGKIQYENNTFTFPDFVAHTYGGLLEGRASIVVPSGNYFVASEMFEIGSAKFFKFISWEQPFPKGRIDGNFMLDKIMGKDLDLIAHAKYRNTTENFENQLTDRLQTMETDLEMKDSILTLSNTRLSTENSELFIDGTIHLSEKELSLAIELQSSDAADLSAPYFIGLQSPLTFRGRVEGSSEAPEITGSITVGSGILNGEPVERASGDIAYTPESLSVKLLKARYGGAVYEVSGSIDFRKTKGLFSFDDPYYRAEAAVRNGDAGSLLRAAYREIPLQGLVDAQLSFEGDTQKFSGYGKVILEDGFVLGQKFEHAVVETELTENGMNFPFLEISNGDSSLQAYGSLDFEKKFVINVTSDRLNLKDIAYFKNIPVDASGNLQMRGSGTFRNPAAEFSVNVVESYFNGSPIGSGTIRGDLKDDTLSVFGDLLEDRVKVDAALELSDPIPWHVNMDIDKGRYDFILAGFLEDEPEDLAASLEGSVRLTGKGKKISMDSEFQSLHSSLYGYTIRNTDTIVLKLKDDEFVIQSLAIEGDKGTMEVSGAMKIGSSYDVHVDGGVDLAPLKALTKTVESLDGEGSFSMTVSGPWETPKLRGEIHIADTSMLLPNFSYRIGPMNGDIFFDKEKFTFESFHTDFAGGSIDMSGVGYLQKLALKRLAVFSELEGIRFRPAEGLDVAIDGSVFLEKTPLKQSLSGDLNIRRARYTKRIEWKSGLLKLREAGIAPPDQLSDFEKTELNIFIKGDKDIMIDNNIARTPVKMDLNINGTLAEYGLTGRIETRGGSIFFRGNEFEIIEGNVDFIESSKITPVFHIQSETFIKGYRLRLDLDGPADKFTLAFFSDPPLDDSEILTLLTSGQITKGTEGIEGGIGAGEATAFLTGRLQDVMEERVKDITGFERFEINPHTSSTGAVSSRFTVGQQMLDGKLLVTYSSSVGSTELDVIRLRYKLTNNISVVGLRDEIGSIGGDIRYRFEFK
jgi:translocation and assembly module TamB